MQGLKRGTHAALCAVNESTDRRAVRTTAMETTAIVVISIVQIVYVRKLFAKSGAGLLPRFGV